MIFNKKSEQTKDTRWGCLIYILGILIYDTDGTVGNIGVGSTKSHTYWKRFTYLPTYKTIYPPTRLLYRNQTTQKTTTNKVPVEMSVNTTV